MLFTSDRNMEHMELDQKIGDDFSSNLGDVPECHSEERVKPKGKAFI